MVEFKDLWRGHPINESVSTPCIAPKDLVNLEGKPVKEGFPVFANQCAIRVGVSLRRAGVQPSQISGCAHCSVHKREDMHFINATALARAIDRANLSGVKPVQKLSGDKPAQFYPELFGRTGIVFIKDYWHRSGEAGRTPTGDHIDIWNGYRSTSKWLMEWFSWLGYYSNYAGAKEIWFWEVD
jgi:Type VI secretion system (T6SS), amidase effector protein 4